MGERQDGCRRNPPPDRPAAGVARANEGSGANRVMAEAEGRAGPRRVEESTRTSCSLGHLSLCSVGAPCPLLAGAVNYVHMAVYREPKPRRLYILLIGGIVLAYFNI